MKSLEKVGKFVSNNIAYMVILVSIIAFVQPVSFLWAVPKTTLLLQIIMFGMGLTLTAQDFAMVLKKPWQVFLIAFVQFGWMPLSGFLLSKLFNLPPELAIGVILVGSCPGGTASNVMTYIAGGMCLCPLQPPVYRPYLHQY